MPTPRGPWPKRRDPGPTRRGLGRLFGSQGAAGLAWTREDALVTVAAAVVDLIGYTVVPELRDGSVTAVGLLLSVLSALPLLFRRRHPLPVMAAVLVLGAVLNLAVPAEQHFGAVLTVALYSTARACRPVPTVAATAAAVALSVFHRNSSGLTFLDVLLACFAAALVVIAALVVNRWQQETESNRRLLAERAVAEERRRIARELHDIIAHHITTMQLMAGGARANLRNPGVAREALVTLEESGRLALSEMRQLLDVLRADDYAAPGPRGVPEAPQPGVADLDRLVKEARQAGQPTGLTVDGDPGPLPPVVGLTVYRIVQEALTNARKHAGPTVPTEVHLACLPGRLTVRVTDRGAYDGAEPAGALGGGSGYGLTGMRERVALHGGTLEAGPLPGGGFRVAASLPLEPPANENEES
ncbi:sensor histidine kinase [Streptomyces sp. NPDC015220]|uniref:sensor histidine kinase n=1 Tax=Streptomyces sp. NPDC015220 TaxID=3364947 RepID=UPI0037032206